ncbi:hypothetical protein DFO73_101219 [Cytobacillus oceanisediminis]|uniref:Uncharacterized protein n=1 Tax=Cytobacillus oceanisediminis TaxID=665099 RepID=A0A2V3A700_9BACI|nr:hypothetical protein DFO73_101219 [Cytobacillus oceanisediminis]
MIASVKPTRDSYGIIYKRSLISILMLPAGGEKLQGGKWSSTAAPAWIMAAPANGIYPILTGGTFFKINRIAITKALIAPKVLVCLCIYCKRFWCLLHCE